MPQAILEVLEKHFAKADDLKGRKVLITAGPTYERIDPVRFIGNYSTGKMGYATPVAIFAMVDAVAGAMTMASAHSPRSPWLCHSENTKQVITRIRMRMK